jgi:hypothetical protein
MVPPGPFPEEAALLEDAPRRSMLGVTEGVQSHDAHALSQLNHRVLRLGGVAQSPRRLRQDVARRCPISSLKPKTSAPKEPTVSA